MTNNNVTIERTARDGMTAAFTTAPTRCGLIFEVTGRSLIAERPSSLTCITTRPYDVHADRKFGNDTSLLRFAVCRAPD